MRTLWGTIMTTVTRTIILMPTLLGWRVRTLMFTRMRAPMSRRLRICISRRGPTRTPTIIRIRMHTSRRILTYNRLEYQVPTLMIIPTVTPMPTHTSRCIVTHN